ncbi:hypothetical protein SEA_ARGAN_65 [Arthrobacter phage Argan]|nr:hypothetical protein SEA_ARGAN_65 [Arthrobacter phage Argan]
MATFKKTEVVDGRQFTGGTQNGTNLVQWVLSGGGQAMWYSAYRKAPESIVLNRSISPFGFDKVYVGDWIIRKQNGEFIALRPQDLDSEGYEIQ